MTASSERCPLTPGLPHCCDSVKEGSWEDRCKSIRADCDAQSGAGHPEEVSVRRSQWKQCADRLRNVVGVEEELWE